MKSIICTHLELQKRCSNKFVKQNCQKIFDLSSLGKTQFEINEDNILVCADLIVELLKNSNQHNLISPLNQWQYFSAGQVNRIALMDIKLSHLSPIEIARVKFDLLVLFVLLNSGPFGDWTYKEDDQVYNGSEALAVALYHMFSGGHFSASYGRSVDATGLKRITLLELEEGLHITIKNSMDGIHRRLEIIQELAELLEQQQLFRSKRPADFLEILISKFPNQIKDEEFIDLFNIYFGQLFAGNILFNEKHSGDWWYDLDLPYSLDSIVFFHQVPSLVFYAMAGVLATANIELENAEGCLFELLPYTNLLSAYDIYKYKGADLDFDLIYNEQVLIEWRAVQLALFNRLINFVIDILKHQNYTATFDEIISLGIKPLSEKFKKLL